MYCSVCHGGERIPLPEPSADLHGTCRDQNHPGRNSATGCRHLGVEEGDPQTEHNPVSLFSLGNQAQKLSLCPASPLDPTFSPFSFQRLLPSPHPPAHQPTPPFLHRKSAEP